MMYCVRVAVDPGKRKGQESVHMHTLATDSECVCVCVCVCVCRVPSRGSIGMRTQRRSLTGITSYRDEDGNVCCQIDGNN